MNKISEFWFSKNSIRSLFFPQKALFILILFINAALMLSVKFYPSMDGPSHLYNSNLLLELIFNKTSELHNYFVINNFPIANWMSMILLALFNYFLPAWLAEKIVLLIYLFGICLSFRYLIKQLNPKGIGLSFIIFPFVYNFLFHLGFYNYSLSFVFLFLAIGLWVKFHGKFNFKQYLVLFFLMSGLYFSALLTFLFAGLCMGFITLALFLDQYTQNESGQKQMTSLFKHLLLLLIVSFPYLILTIWFLSSTHFYSTDHQYSVNELVKWLNDVRCLIIYDYPGDEKLSQQILHIVIAFVAISLYLRFSKHGRPTLLFTDVLLIPLTISLILYFMIPNGNGAGMMSDRYCQMSFLLFIIWVASQSLPPKTISVFILFITVFHFGLLLKHHNGVIRDLDRNASTIANTAKYIDSQSIVLPINLSSGWIEPHFSNYLGIDKPMIILENYEASIGWFPLQWSTSKMPDVKLGELSSINQINWPTNQESNQVRQIDYVFLYGELSNIEDPEWIGLKKYLDENYISSYTSDDHYVQLFKIREKLE